MTSDKIIRVVAKHTNVSVSELMSKTRRRAVSQPRQIVHYLLNTELVGVKTQIWELV